MRTPLKVFLGVVTAFLVGWQLFSLFVMPLVPPPWPPVYWALPIHAQVVDADTGKPLEGVIVTANWELAGPWEGIGTEQVAVMETVTDEHGRFSFQWWRPRLRRILKGEIHYNDPQLLLFKSGYKVGSCRNDLFSPGGLFAKPYHRGLFRWSDCNGKVIKLEKFKGSLEEYAKHVGYLDDRLDFAFYRDDCSWKKIPRMLVAMHLEERRFKEKGIPTYRTPILDRENRAAWAEPSKCGSVREFLRSDLP